MIQVVREATAEYTYFINQILTLVTQRMGKEYHARIVKVTKNNSLELDSLVLLKEGKNFAPNIYLQPYYEAYRQGVGMQELVKRICSIYGSCVKLIVDESFCYNLEGIKHHIIYRLVNYERNRELLEHIPHIKFLDLAITYYCLVKDDEEGIGTIRITKEHMKQWNTNLQELHTLAAENTWHLLPSCMKSMEEVIKGILLEECDIQGPGVSDVPGLEESDAQGEEGRDCKGGNDYQQVAYSVTGTSGSSEDRDDREQHSMYILTNNKGIHGASCLLYHKVLSDFSDRVQSDFYIFPSSVHEVILVPASDHSKWKEYSKIIREVNESQVAPEELLSDHVYFYSKRKGLMLLD